VGVTRAERVLLLRDQHAHALLCPAPAEKAAALVVRPRPASVERRAVARADTERMRGRGPDRGCKIRLVGGAKTRGGGGSGAGGGELGKPARRAREESAPTTDASERLSASEHAPACPRGALSESHGEAIGAASRRGLRGGGPHTGLSS
jgi:hypothetical protein